MEIDEIIETIQSNLKKNGFPNKKVSFPLASIEAFAKKNDYDFEDIVGILEDKNIFSKIENQKIIFSSNELEQKKPLSDIDWSMLEKMNPELLKEQAENLMKTMSPDQLSEIKKKFENLSPSEKEKIMEMAGKI